MRNYNQYLEVLFQVKKGTEIKAFATICFEGFFFKLQLSNKPNKNLNLTNLTKTELLCKINLVLL